MTEKKAKKVSRKAKVATTTPAPAAETQVQSKTMPVGRIGWDNENPIIPILLLDKKTRMELALEVGNLVAVTKGSKRTVAIVQLQFWELVGTGKCTINKKLGELIADVAVDDLVTISKDVLESEKLAFDKALAQTRGRSIAELIGRALRDAQGDENPGEE